MDGSDSATPSVKEVMDAFNALQQQFSQLKAAQRTQGATGGSALCLPGLALLSTFSGDTDEDPAAWVFSCGQYFRVHGVADNHRVLVASSQLRGSALLWWRSHCQSAENGACEPITAWPEFCDALQLQFSPINP